MLRVGGDSSAVYIASTLLLEFSLPSFFIVVTLFCAVPILSSSVLILPYIRWSFIHETHGSFVTLHLRMRILILLPTF